jgi:hypothetical protein
MNPYLASRLADDRIGSGPGGRPHVDGAAWLLRSETTRTAGWAFGTVESRLGSRSRRSTAGRHGGGPHRVRRRVGWALVEAGLRLATGRSAAATQRG